MHSSTANSKNNIFLHNIMFVHVLYCKMIANLLLIIQYCYSFVQQQNGYGYTTSFIFVQA